MTQSDTHISENAEDGPVVSDSSLLISPQPRLGSKGLIVLMVVANMLVPFSLDMYTPAVPSLPEYFGTTSAVINLTLSGFYLFFTLGLLLFGPVSDRLGRKPVLIGGLVAYVAGSALCALAINVWMLIVFRFVEALGAGATLAVSMAIIKDCFAGSRRMQMLAILQVLGVVGPIAAPLIGGIIMDVATWRMTFWALAVTGGICCLMALLYRESLPDDERLDVGVFRSLGRLTVIARNRGFMLFLVVIAFFNLGFMAYIASASYIYVDYFGQSEQVYTYFFAASAALTVPGPILSIRILKHISQRTFTWILLGLGLVSGVLLFLFGHASPFAFCGIFLIFCIAGATSRPYTTDILLSQNKGDTGSASSMLNFVINMFGVVGMALMSLPWANLVSGLATVTIVGISVSIVLWIVMLRSPSCKMVGGDGSI